jgi:hypothetical protein
VTSPPIATLAEPTPAAQLLLQHQLEELQSKLETATESNERKQKQISSLLQTTNILQSQKEEELRRQISSLSRTITDRDAAAARLTAEVEKRTQAIRGCGEEIVRLRSTAKEATLERDDLAARLKDIVETEKKEMARIYKLVKSDDPHGTPDPALLNQMRILTTRYQQQSSDLREAMAANENLSGIIKSQEYQMEQFNELQKVMAKQAKQLGKMDKLEAKLAAYRSTVAMQEKVIAKLENAIEVRIKQDAKRGPAAWAKQEIAATERAISLEKELNEERVRSERELTERESEVKS